MNYRMIVYIMGQILRIVGLCMLLPIAVGAMFGESHVIASFAYNDIDIDFIHAEKAV